MNTFIFGCYIWFYCRQSFGGCYCPPNWEPLAIAHQQVAEGLLYVVDIVARAAQWVPKYSLSPDPTPEELASFVSANADSFNGPVFDAFGNVLRICPFVMYVDDQFIAHVKTWIHQAVAAGVLSLYMILGFPHADEPDPLSHDKFDTVFSHRRKMNGVMVDTRSMTLSMADYKRTQLLDMLENWLEPNACFTLKEYAMLCGTLVDHSNICVWSSMFIQALMQQIRQTLRSRFFLLQRQEKRGEIKARVLFQLPKELEYRLDNICLLYTSDAADE